MTVDTLLGQQIDEYRLEALLGQGGMARVYRGLDVHLNRYVAIKVIDTPFRSDTDYVTRFKREAQAIAQLEHPHIVRLYRYGDVDNLLYMAMQYIDGKDLQTMLMDYEEKGELMAPEEVSRLIRQVCLALDAAHAKGVIHRDMKPANVMVRQGDGQAFVTDFGLALMTELGTRGEIFGTPQYIAPEQAISSAGVVPQSDFYAVGVMLYRLFTGTLPFDAADPLEVAMWHVTETPPPPRQVRPTISPALEAVILKSLAKEPQDRYANGATLANALDEALVGAAPDLAASVPSGLSIMERASLDLPPVPPLPAAVTPRQPAVPSPQLTVTPEAWAASQASTMTAQPEAAAAPARKFPVGIGIAAVAVLILVLGFLWMRNREQNELVAEGAGLESPVPTEAADVVRTPSEAVTPSPTSSSSDEGAAAATPVGESEPANSVTPETAVDATLGTWNWLPLVVVAADGGEPVASAPTATSVPAPTATSVPVPTATSVPVPTATAVAVATDYEIVLIKADKTLFLVNMSGRPFPLDSLILEMDGPGDEGFADWQQVQLPAGRCILINKDDKAKEQPLPDGCNQAVNRAPLIFKWKDRFTVLYDDNLVADCEVNKEDCQITITTTTEG